VKLYEIRKPTKSNPRRKVWQLRWYGGDGTRYGEIIGDCSRMTKREANARRKEKEAAFRSHEIPVDRPRKMTLAQFKTYVQESYQTDMRATTMIEMQIALDHAIKALRPDIQIASITPTHVNQIKNRVGVTLKRSDATLNKTIRSLRALWYRAMTDEILHKNPFAKRKMKQLTPTKQRPFSREEVAAMRESAPSLWWEAFILLGVTTGLRKSEMLHLKWADLTWDDDLQNGSVTVCPKRAGRFTVGGREYPILPWDVKDHEIRHIPTIPPEAVRLLNQLKIKCGGSPYVFLSLERLARLDIRIRAGTLPPEYRAMHNLLKQFKVIQKDARQRLAVSRGVSLDKVEWPVGRIHDLRATFGTETALDVPVFTLCEWMGHSDPKTTAKFYVKTLKTTVDAARQAMASRYGQTGQTDTILTPRGKKGVLGVANSTENPVIGTLSA